MERSMVTKEEWAIAMLAKAGNHDPKPESIKFYVDMLDGKTSPDATEAQIDFQEWCIYQYNHPMTLEKAKVYGLIPNTKKHWWSRRKKVL